jgi:hypothetical protein
MTTIEVEARKAELTATMTSELAEAKKCKPMTDEFNVHYDLYRKVDEEFAKAKESEKHLAIKADCDTLGTAIGKLIEGLKLAEKLGEPIKSCVYVVDSEGKSQVTINKVTRIASKAGEGKGNGKGHVKIVDGQGNEQSVTAFIKAHATAAELATAAYKYPHTQADSKAKFEAFCTAHNLTGYEYRLPAEEAQS